MREIIFDTETTGLDPKSGDRLVEIGCIEMVNRIATGETFHAYFNPQRDMPAEATRAEALLEFLGDAPLVAHNAGFDFGFLNTELAACGRDPVSLDRMIDTVKIARAKHPGAKNSLDALCTRYGVDRSHRTLHGALLDAELLAQVYVELLGGRQIGMALAGDAVKAASPSLPSNAASDPSTRQRPFREPRVFAASEEELAQHQAFLKSLKEPIWLS